MFIVQSSLLQAAATFAIAWVIWKAVKNYLIPSPLDKIPGPPPSSIIKGNIDQLFSRQGWVFHDDVGEKYNYVVRITGFLNKPMLYVYDPKALHSILVKDTYTFDMPKWTTANLEMLLGPGLLTVRGDHHKRQRKMLNPVFSAKHMKGMTPLFYRIARKVQYGIGEEVKHGPADVDIFVWLGRTALEVIGQGGLGYSLDPLLGGKPSPLGDTLKVFLPTMANIGWLQMLSGPLRRVTTSGLRQLLGEWVPSKRLHAATKQMTDTIDLYSRKIFESKKQALLAGDDTVTHQVEEQNDIMSILLKANVEAAESDRLPEEEVIGQIALLVLAATDTTTNSLTQIMQLLAKHQDVQDKLRSEIVDAIRQNGGDRDLPHDVLVNLPYMDAICRETLRLHTPVVHLFREHVCLLLTQRIGIDYIACRAQEDGILPLHKPIQCTDGTTMTEIPVPKGTYVLAGLRACNLNKELWGEDVKEWKPERWLSPLPQAVIDAHIPGVYSNLMTFGGGGRSCIGFKFSQLEMTSLTEVVLSVLIPAFKLSPADNDDEITWNLGGIRYPTIGTASNESSCPIKMRRIEVDA
ncbi:cytochrome P450 [Panus rudis PR-1116 ss-1]|nr:cytochrome P450 [Panus rudis PR-1116 ss-1]